MDRLFFWFFYLMGRAGWDSGIVPPEIVALIEEEKLSPGRAIDLGCGTGTTSIYLAQHGWQVVGIDYVRSPIRKARAKAARAGVSGQARFVVGDIRRIDQVALPAPFDLAIDIGCGHNLSPDEWGRYARNLAHLVRPGGLLMLYAFCPTSERSRGVTPEQVEEIFAPDFRVVRRDMGSDRVAGSGSAWYSLERVG
jgi:cyclopropane fatty-acyl-phospholipid synthase-like methyltransferase